MNQPRRRSPLKIVLITVAVLLVVCCGAGAAAVYFGITRLVGPARDATDAFLTDLEADRTDAAYDRLCRSLQQSTGRADFTGRYGGRKVTSHDLEWGGSYDNSNGVETARVTADVDFAGSGSGSTTFSLVKEGGDWKVCTLP